MSNNYCEEYWKPLENGSAPNEMAKMGQAMKLLIQAYKEDLPVYVACQYTNAEGTEAKDTCSPGTKVAVMVTLLPGMVNWLSVTVMGVLLASVTVQLERQ